MATKYLRLFDPTQQFQLKGGQLNVAGRLYVHLEATDDLADLYDENGVQLTQPVTLDNNGRAAGLFVDAAKVYWLDVQDQYGMSQFTIRKMTPCGGGGGSLLGGSYDVTSSDGSISVDKSVDGGVTTFDLTRPEDTVELLEWIRCDGSTRWNVCGDTFVPIYTDGTMEVGTKGIKLYGGHYYHVTAHIRITKPDHAEPWYDEMFGMFVCDYGHGEETVVTQKSLVADYSMGLTQEYEISTDVLPEADCELLIDVADQTINQYKGIELIDVEAHRIYSGAPTLPMGVASKPWIAENYQPLLTAGDNIYIDTTTWTISASGGSGGGSIYNSGDGTIVHNTGNHEIDIDWTKVQPKLTAGEGISIVNNVISAVGGGGGGDYTGENGIYVDNVNRTIGLDSDVVIDPDYHHTDNNFTDGDKSKLDGIEAGAEKNVQSDWLQNNSAADDYIKNRPDLSQYATQSDITQLETDISGKADKVANATAGNLAGLDATGNLTDSGVSPTNLVHDPNYVHTDYNFSLTYVNKIDGIETGAQKNVQSDWLEDDPTSDAYILHKPNIPSALYDTKELVAGPNITLTDINNIVTIDTAVPGVVVGYITL